MKKALVIFLSVALLSLCSCAAIFHKIAEKWIEGIEELKQDGDEITYASTRFREVHQRWPESEKELRAFTAAEAIPFDWSRYSRAHFHARKDGSVEVIMTYAPPKNGVVSAVVGAPQQSMQVEVGAGIGTNSR